MGQGFADAALIKALGSGDDFVSTTALSIGSMRSRMPVARRLPLSRLARAPFRVQTTVGRLIYTHFDLVHRLDLRLPPAAPEILTVHDLAPLRFLDEGTLPSYTATAIHRARAVICPSQFSAGEIRRFYGREDVDVILNGLDPAFRAAKPLDPSERRARGLPDRWVLHSGGATLRKNLAGLAAAWPIVRRRCADVALLMCGPSDPRRARLFDGLPGVRQLGRVPRVELIDLTASAVAVVVPSVYEGFGLPAQEAMICGVPVVATAAGALPEVVGDGGLLVEDNPEALADGILRALEGLPPRTLERARTLAASRTWEKNAAAHLAVYRRVAEDLIRARG